MRWYRRLWHRQLKRPIRLAYTIKRGRGETVLLLHGIASNKAFWQPLAARLEATDKTIISMDLLGHGDSLRPSWLRYSTEDQAAAVRATLRSIHVHGPITIVGHSMGALVAVHIASRRPEYARRLVLYEPPIFADLSDYPGHLRRRNIYFRIFERLAANPSGGLTLAKVLGKLTYNWGSFLKSEDTWLPIERGLRNSIMQQSVYKELHDISVPTAMVHGRFDVVVTSAELKKMYKSNPHITFYKTTANHGMNVVSARFLARLIAPELIVRDTIKSKASKETKVRRRRHASDMERTSHS